ncbi:ester cyclase [Rhodococcus sp. NPDC003382]
MTDTGRTTSSTVTDPPTDASNADLVRWAIGRINAEDIDSLRNRLWTAESVVYFPTGSCRGATEIGAYFDRVYSAVTDFAMEISAIAESGDDVLVHWRLSGRHTGTLFGVAGTGRHVELEGFDHFVLAGGKVVTNTVRYDQMEFARQIKMLPPDGSIPDRVTKAIFNAATRIARLARRR